MSTLNMIKVIKQVHKQDVLLVKVGKFYNAYGKDAYILSDLFSYKIKIVEDKIFSIVFRRAGSALLLKTYVFRT